MLVLVQSCVKENSRILFNVRRRSCVSFSSYHGKTDYSKKTNQKTIVSEVSSKLTPISTPPTSTGARVVPDAVGKPILVTNQEAGCLQIDKPQNPNLQFEIQSIIDSWKRDVSASDAKAFLCDRLKECSLNQVCRLMRLLGKKSRSKLHMSLKPHLPAVASHLESLSSSSWTINNIGSVVYGLQCFEEEDDGYLSIISLVTKIANKSFISKGNPSSSEISSIITGLQKNRVKSPKSREFLSCLTSIVIKSTDKVGNRTLSIVLHGLRCIGA
jgi:hypothetical protein